jgi:hypothetical protein
MIKSIKPYKRRCLTLLEMLVCMTLLTILAFLIGTPAYQSIKYARFDKSCKLIISKLEELQILGLTYGSDMQLKFFEKKGKKYLMPRVHESALRSIDRKEYALEEIEQFIWHPISSKSGSSAPIDSFYIALYSTGRWESCGILEIKGVDQTLYLDLQQPLYFKLTRNRPAILPLLKFPRPTFKHSNPSIPPT